MATRLLSDETLQRLVLIVEDEQPLAEAIAVTLQMEGLRTIVAFDGDRALDMARGMQPDLVLLDVMMPGKSGVEVCATLKTDPATAQIPVVILTAKAEDEDRALGLAAGADAYVVKPFSPTELIALVNEALAGQYSDLGPSRSDPSAMPADQLVVYAHELRDLFKREQLERQALEIASRRLGELDRLKAAFLGVVTHELLTPFADIGLALQVLQRECQEPTLDLQESVDELATKIAGLYRLVSGVVKFAELVSKRRDPKLRSVSLDHLIPRAVQPVAVLAEAREVDFRVLVPSDLPKVHADPELLDEAIFQMAHNAVKFNLPGGRAQVRAFESEEWVVVEVTDTGVGLGPERLAVLGQPFEQSADALRRGQEGLGIGWTFVRYVAEVHGGATSVESAGPRQGSTFRLVLPIAPEARGSGGPADTTQ